MSVSFFLFLSIKLPFTAFAVIKKRNNNMSIKPIQEGTPAGTVGQPVLDKQDPGTISKTDEEVSKICTVINNKEFLETNEEWELHGYSIYWGLHQSYPWADRVEDLMERAGEQIRSNNLYSARVTLHQIRVAIYRR
jgi:hypothetical protein